MVRLRGFLVSIILYRVTEFTGQFWMSYKKGLGSKVNLSTIFHPKKMGKQAHYPELKRYVDIFHDRYQRELG